MPNATDTARLDWLEAKLATPRVAAISATPRTTPAGESCGAAITVFSTERHGQMLHHEEGSTLRAAIDAARTQESFSIWCRTVKLGHDPLVGAKEFARIRDAYFSGAVGGDDQ